jgi:hypothetical protein
MALLGFSIWLGMLAAAGLTFPRRPVVSGFLFIALGVILRYLSTARSLHPLRQCFWGPPASGSSSASGKFCDIPIRNTPRRSWPCTRRPRTAYWM